MAINRLYAEGKTNFGIVDVGRIEVDTYFHYAGPVNGISVTYGDKFKVSGFYGRLLDANLVNPGSAVGTIKPAVYGDNNISGVYITAPINDKLTAYGGYMSVNPTNPVKIPVATQPRTDSQKYKAWVVNSYKHDNRVK